MSQALHPHAQILLPIGDKNQIWLKRRKLMMMMMMIYQQPNAHVRISGTTTLDIRTMEGKVSPLWLNTESHTTTFVSYRVCTTKSVSIQ
jgi:hypothetical protein